MTSLYLALIKGRQSSTPAARVKRLLREGIAKEHELLPQHWCGIWRYAGERVWVAASLMFV